MTLSTRRRNTGPDLHTTMAVLSRDGYRCIRCRTAAMGAPYNNWTLHHRRPRAMGGTRRADTNSPANLLTVCNDCHAYIEANRAEALASGWLVQQFSDPTKVFCLVEDGSRVVYLAADGEYSDNPPDGEP